MNLPRDPTFAGPSGHCVKRKMKEMDWNQIALNVSRVNNTHRSAKACRIKYKALEKRFKREILVWLLHGSRPSWVYFTVMLKYYPVIWIRSRTPIHTSDYIHESPPNSYHTPSSKPRSKETGTNPLPHHGAPIHDPLVSSWIPPQASVSECPKNAGGGELVPVAEVQTTESPIAMIQPDIQEWRLVPGDDLSSQNEGFGSRDSETGPKSYNPGGEAAKRIRVLRSLFNGIWNSIETTMSRINMDFGNLVPISDPHPSENCVNPHSSDSRNSL